MSSVWNLICFQGCTLCPGSPPSCGGQPRDADGQPRDHGHFMGDSLGGLPSLRLEALEARELGTQPSVSYIAGLREHVPL